MHYAKPWHILIVQLLRMIIKQRDTYKNDNAQHNFKKAFLLYHSISVHSYSNKYLDCRLYYMLTVLLEYMYQSVWGDHQHQC